TCDQVLRRHLLYPLSYGRGRPQRSPFALVPAGTSGTAAASTHRRQLRRRCPQPGRLSTFSSRPAHCPASRRIVGRVGREPAAADMGTDGAAAIRSGRMVSMNAATLTLVGNIASEPEVRTVAGGIEVTNFRLAASDRKFDQSTGEWVDTSTLFL